jgi:cell division protein FtsL
MKRFRISTLLFVVAILALLLLVVMQQVQIGRMQSRIGQMRKTIDADVKSNDQLTAIIRELRDQLERQSR